MPEEMYKGVLIRKDAGRNRWRTSLDPHGFTSLKQARQFVDRTKGDPGAEADLKMHQPLFGNPQAGYYIVAPTVSDWHSQAFRSAEAAQEWLDGYMVDQGYKDRTYRIVPVGEYWKRRGYNQARKPNYPASLQWHAVADSQGVKSIAFTGSQKEAEAAASKLVHRGYGAYLMPAPENAKGGWVKQWQQEVKNPPSNPAALVVPGRGFIQESYETGDPDIKPRAAMLRKMGYKATVFSMGSQVTPVGHVKMTMIDIRPGTSGDQYLENVPPAKAERWNPAPLGSGARFRALESELASRGDVAEPNPKTPRPWIRRPGETWQQMEARSMKHPLGAAIQIELEAGRELPAEDLAREVERLTGIKITKAQVQKWRKHGPLRDQYPYRERNVGTPLGSGARFRALESELASRGDVADPKALAAAIGRRKYGVKTMAKMAAAGRTRSMSKYNPDSATRENPGGEYYEIGRDRQDRFVLALVAANTYLIGRYASLEAAKHAAVVDSGRKINWIEMGGGGVKPWWEGKITSKRLRGNPAYKGNSTKRNPEQAAAELSEVFHGRPAEEVEVIKTRIKTHEWLTKGGDLAELTFTSLTGFQVTVGWINQRTNEIVKDAPRFAFSENGKQFYIEGGDQSMDLARFDMDTPQWVRDQMILGVLTEAVYRTEKRFDKFRPTDYQHDVGEETGWQPMVGYDPYNKLLSIWGGQYKVETKHLVEGMSPGVVN